VDKVLEVYVWRASLFLIARLALSIITQQETRNRVYVRGFSLIYDRHWRSRNPLLYSLTYKNAWHPKEQIFSTGLSQINVRQGGDPLSLQRAQRKSFRLGVLRALRGSFGSQSQATVRL
jgi:hypothetical protein